MWLYFFFYYQDSQHACMALSILAIGGRKLLSFDAFEQIPLKKRQAHELIYLGTFFSYWSIYCFACTSIFYCRIGRTDTTARACPARENRESERSSLGGHRGITVTFRSFHRTPFTEQFLYHKQPLTRPSHLNGYAQFDFFLPIRDLESEDDPGLERSKAQDISIIYVRT